MKANHRARLDDVCSLLREQCRRQKPNLPDAKRQAVSNTGESTEGEFLSLLKHLRDFRIAKLVPGAPQALSRV